MAFYPRLSQSSSGSFGDVSEQLWYNYVRNNVPYTVPMPNCTTYAYGRTIEIAMQNGYDWYAIKQGYCPYFWSGGNYGGRLYGDAETWYTDNIAKGGWSYGNFAQVGAIACWSGTLLGLGGHVGIVERVNADGTVDISNSSFGGTYWWLQRNVRLTVGSVTSFVGEIFQGYIYNPYVSDVPPEPPTPTEEPYMVVSPSSYSVTMTKDMDYIDFTFSIYIYNVPSGETASGGNSYPGLSRIYNTGWTYSGTTAFKTQTLRYERESNRAYEITKYMYFDIDFSTGSVHSVTPMYIEVERKGAVLFLDGMGIDVHII